MTARSYASRVDLFLRSGQDALTWLRAVGRGTARCRLASLRAYYRWRGGPDATAGIKLTKGKHVSKPPFTQDELGRMLAACRTLRERIMLRILMTTGIRLSELRGLRHEDIGADGLTLIHGKGSRDRYLYLPGDALALLSEWTERRSGWLFAAYERGTPGSCRGQLVSTYTLWSVVKAVARRAGVRGAHPHRFRVTFSCAFIRTGGDVGALRVALGHSTIQMSLEYASFTETERALAHQRGMAAG